MRSAKRILIACLIVAAAVAFAGEQPTSLDAVVDRIAAREAEFVNSMRSFNPLVETYIQQMQADKDLGAVPMKDEYFLGRMSWKPVFSSSMFVEEKKGFLQRMGGKLMPLHVLQFEPRGFMQMAFIDFGRLDRQHYDFTFVRREFLGEVRCLAFDVVPRPGAGKGMFMGRIWVEDQDYNVVRFNGTYVNAPFMGAYFHFDSWRVQMGPGVWLPAYTYTEETGQKIGLGRVSFKAQTRFWSYDVARSQHNSELTKVLVEAPAPVKDQSDSVKDVSPVQGQRTWEQQAEANLIERFERAGLIAPDGEVSKLLETVVNNVAVTNNLDIQPEVRCRVLLTTPIESFTVGHTIVISRGLLDVLPDEASLAAMLSHELAHIILGHRVDTKYAFSDRMIFDDEMAFVQLAAKHTPLEEKEADETALKLIANSPYQNKVANPGLFIAQLRQRAPQLPKLLRAHVGSGLIPTGGEPLLSGLTATAPNLEPKNTAQIAALPLGGRIKLDPWSNNIQILKSAPVSQLSAREKMPLEITPLFPYLTRQAQPAGSKVAVKQAGTE